MSFRTGHFQKEKIAQVLHPFCPIRAAHSLTELDLQDLWSSGKRLILLDVDNTLVEWKQENFEASVLDWLSAAKQIGFKLCILSNTRHPERLGRISERLDIPFIRDRFKPSTRMYEMALAQFGLAPEQALMVGDQILTDILGANRSGIEAVWVHRISEREFIGTRIGNRVAERFLVRFLYRALPVVSKLPDPVGAPEQTSLQVQVFRFGVVGVSSLVIDTAVLYLLSHVVRVGGVELGTNVGQYALDHFPAVFHGITDPQKAATSMFKPISTIVAMMNSFYWNRKWTFGITDTADRKVQFRRFVLLNIGGLIIATVAINIFVGILSGSSGRVLLLAQLLATVIQAVWNFGGQRLWAFKR